jgi:hypothetical protein
MSRHSTSCCLANNVTDWPKIRDVQPSGHGVGFKQNTIVKLKQNEGRFVRGTGGGTLKPEFKVISCHIESVCRVEIKCWTCTEMSGIDNSKHVMLSGKCIGRVADKLIFGQPSEDFCWVGGRNIYYHLNHWVMHPVACVSTNICRNLRTHQMSVLVLLCTFYTKCFGPYWWPSSGGL